MKDYYANYNAVIGASLRRFREDEEMSRQDLSAATKGAVKWTTIRDIETARMRVRVDDLAIICATLGVSLNVFMLRVEERVYERASSGYAV